MFCYDYYCELSLISSVDGVSVRTHTPPRKSASLHNPAAYPTPQSISRSPRPASIPPPQTPLSCNYPSGIQEDNHNSDDDDDQIDTDGVSIAVENTGSYIFHFEQELTCHNVDWDNIAHVTAISKALQERNDMLQQKMEVLEKEKEEVCGEG